jgi:hypothetical protein
MTGSDSTPWQSTCMDRSIRASPVRGASGIFYFHLGFVLVGLPHSKKCSILPSSFKPGKTGTRFTQLKSAKKSNVRGGQK